MKKEQLEMFAQSESEAGRAGAEKGMSEAHDHAEAFDPGWSDRAFAFLLRYITAHPGKEIIAPEVRKWSERNGLSAPASNYAWGHVFKKASMRRLILPLRFGTYGDSTMHTQSIQVWTAA